MESKSKKDLKLDCIAECHEIKDKNIVHMSYTSNNKCLVFVREGDPPN